MMLDAIGTISEKPILVSGPLIGPTRRRIKTQTRRPLKVQPPSDVTSFGYSPSTGWVSLTGDPKDIDTWIPGDEIKCPYGQPGDHLWVREKWQAYRQTSYEYDEWESLQSPKDRHAGGYHPVYAADGKNFPDKWMPSIHMPRAYSRIILKITDVRIQRIQDISPEDARAEGLGKVTKDGGRTWKYGMADRDGLPGTDNYGWPWDQWKTDPVAAFRKLWDSINEKNGFGWDENPWVWAITFQRLWGKRPCN